MVGAAAGCCLFCLLCRRVERAAREAVGTRPAPRTRALLVGAILESQAAAPRRAGRHPVARRLDRRRRGRDARARQAASARAPATGFAGWMRSAPSYDGG